MAHIAFIGLGVMGYPMAGHLARSGHDVEVYNRTVEKAARWVDSFGGRYHTSPGAAAAGKDAVLICVGRDSDLREVTLGEGGAFTQLETGALVIDHTTASANIARELALVAAAKKVDFIDAPVSGGQIGAERGTLSVMAGGSEHAFGRARSLMESYAGNCQLMGDVGSGQLAKMVNQICIAGLLQALAEGINFATCAGLDTDKLLEVIGKGAAGSWQMDNRGATMAEGRFDFGFAVDWMRKDLAICLDEANRNGASLPVTALVDQFYKEIQDDNGGRWDTSSLITRLVRG